MPNYPAPSPPYVGPAKHVMNNGGVPLTGNTHPLNRIVIHGTVSPCVKGGARSIADYFTKTTNYASAHYVVDPGEAVQVVWDDQIAEHAPPNDHSIGIELCDPETGPASRWGDRNHTAMLKRAATLVAQLCLAYDVPVVKVAAGGLLAGTRGICGHADVSAAWHQTDHSDPIGFPWAKFLGMVRTERDRIVKAANKPAPKPKPTPTPRPVPTPAPKPIRPRGARLRVVQWNTHVGRVPDTVFHEVCDLAKSADVLILQETQTYQAVLAKVPGFSLVAYHEEREQDETCILVRDGLEVQALGAVKVTTRGWFTARGHRTPPKWATLATVEGIGFASVHTPPSVQSAWKRRAMPRRWAAYRELMRSMGDVVRRLGPAVVVAVDANVDAGSDHGMSGWPLATFKALRMSRHAPASPTHDTRAIDYAFAKGVRVSAPRVLPKAGSDHCPVSYTVTL